MPGAGDGYVPALRCEALRAVHGVGEHVGIGVATHVQNRYREGTLHRPHEATALRAQLTAHRPPLILQRRMRRRGNLDGAPHVPDGLREVIGSKPFRPRPRLHDGFQPGGVMAGQRSFRPERQLIPQHRRQQCQALVAAGERRRAQRHRMRRTDDRDGLDDAGMEHRGGPAHQSAVGVPDQRRRLVAERPYQPRRIAGQCPAVISPRGFVAATVAAQVDRDHPCAG